MLIYHWPPTFFGLTPKHRPLIHEEIFQLIYFGKGFTHSDVYKMPVYLRKFYLKKLIETRKAEQKATEKATKTNKPNTPHNFKSRFTR